MENKIITITQSDENGQIVHIDVNMNNFVYAQESAGVVAVHFNNGEIMNISSDLWESLKNQWIPENY